MQSRHSIIVFQPCPVIDVLISHTGVSSEWITPQSLQTPNFLHFWIFTIFSLQTLTIVFWMPTIYRISQRTPTTCAVSLPDRAYISLILFADIISTFIFLQHSRHRLPILIYLPCVSTTFNIFSTAFSQNSRAKSSTVQTTS